MNAPVSPTVAAARPSFGPGPEARGTSSAAPFASALDSALSADRQAGGSERGVERRSTPADRADRAADRAEAAGERAEAKAARAAERAADRAARADARAARVQERRAGTGSPEDDAPEVPADGTTDAVPDRAAAEGAPVAPDAGPTGLSGAVWALLMGSTVAATVEGTDASTTGGVAAVGVPVAVAAPAVVPAAPATDTVPAPAVPTAEVAPAAVAPTADLSVTADTGAPAAVTATTTPATAPVPAAQAQAAPGELGLELVTVAADEAGTAAPVPAVAAAVGDAVVAPAPQAAPADAAPTSATGPEIPPPAALLPTDAGTAGDGAGAGGGSTRQDPAVPDPQATTAVTAAGPAPVTTTATPGAPVQTATGADASQPVGSQVARQVAVLRGGPDGTQTMTLVLTPETLGPVEVSVTLHKGSVDLTLRGAHELGRAALLDGLPDLRRDLEAAGLTCSSLQVDRDTGGSWLSRHAAQQGPPQGNPGFSDRGGQQQSGDDRSRPWGAPADTAVSGPTPINHRATSAGVDYRV